MKLIVGLGNPGSEYEKTRHNVGFRVLDGLAALDSNSSWEESKKAQALLLQTSIANEKLLLVKPQTYMNHSGFSVAYFAAYYKIQPTDIWLIHDEVDLLLGRIQLKFGGGSAGHNGLKSVIEKLQTESFWRFRVGIKSEGKDEMDTADFVLEKFTQEEEPVVHDVIKKTTNAVVTALKEGTTIAMNQFNL